MKTTQSSTRFSMHNSTCDSACNLTCNSTHNSTHNSTPFSAQISSQISGQDSAQISGLDSTKASGSYVCGRCKRSLPAEAFYINKKTGCPESYCKECRKAISQQQRDIDKSNLVTKCHTEYPVITRMTDPTLRKALILRALQTVAASIERKRQKLRESDADAEY